MRYRDLILAGIGCALLSSCSGYDNDVRTMSGRKGHLNTVHLNSPLFFRYKDEDSDLAKQARESFRDFYESRDVEGFSRFYSEQSEIFRDRRDMVHRYLGDEDPLEDIAEKIIDGKKKDTNMLRNIAHWLRMREYEEEYYSYIGFLAEGDVGYAKYSAEKHNVDNPLIYGEFDCKSMEEFFELEDDRIKSKAVNVWNGRKDLLEVIKSRREMQEKTDLDGAEYIYLYNGEGLKVWEKKGSTYIKPIDFFPEMRDPEEKEKDKRKYRRYPRRRKWALPA